MNKELVTKINHQIMTSQVNHELKNLWRPISELNVIANKLRSLKAHSIVSKIEEQAKELEKLQLEVKKELLGLN
jgi:hypothetical protein